MVDAVVHSILNDTGRYAQSYHAMQTLNIGQVTPERFKLTDHRGRGCRGNVTLSLNFLPEVITPQVECIASRSRFTSEKIKLVIGLELSRGVSTSPTMYNIRMYQT